MAMATRQAWISPGSVGRRDRASEVLLEISGRLDLASRDAARRPSMTRFRQSHRPPEAGRPRNQRGGEDRLGAAVNRTPVKMIPIPILIAALADKETRARGL